MASGWLPFSRRRPQVRGHRRMLPNTFRHVHYLLPGASISLGMAAFHDSALEAGWNELCVKPSIADRGVGGDGGQRGRASSSSSSSSAAAPSGNLIPALVLSYGARLLFSCTVVSAYSKLWPSHPLKFLLPYNSEDDITPQLRNGCLRRHSNRIQLVHTADSSIYATIKALLEHTHPRQFVFWATDDYLPVEVPDPKRLDAIAAFVQSASKEQPRLLNCCCCLAGVSLARTDGPWAPRDGRATGSTFDNNLRIRLPFVGAAGDGGGTAATLGRLNASHGSIAFFWTHGFWRAGTLRDVFSFAEGSIGPISSAKPLDRLQHSYFAPMLDADTARRRAANAAVDNHHHHSTVLRVRSPYVIRFVEMTHRGKLDVRAAAHVDRDVKVPDRFLPMWNWSTATYRKYGAIGEEEPSSDGGGGGGGGRGRLYRQRRLSAVSEEPPTEEQGGTLSRSEQWRAVLSHRGCHGKKLIRKRMNRTWARAHLRQKGASLHGFVYVYDEWPFNWLPMLERNDCIDPITYASTKACGDLRMAAQLLRKSHPWRTNDPSKARLFYVPALLGLSIWTTPFAKMFTGTNGSCIEKRGKRGTNGSDGDKVWTFAKLVDTLYDALKKTPFFGKRPHLFVSGSFSTPTRTLQIGSGTSQRY